MKREEQVKIIKNTIYLDCPFNKYSIGRYLLQNKTIINKNTIQNANHINCVRELIDKNIAISWLPNSEFIKVLNSRYNNIERINIAAMWSYNGYKNITKYCLVFD